MRWAGHVVHKTVEERCMQGFGGENLRERDQLVDLGVDRMMILECIFKK
jgi:hypothetical protein